jgi:hypothetical protein
VRVIADGHGRPLGWPGESARPHESPRAEATLATGRVPRPCGRPRTRPKAIVADNASDSRACRRDLRRRGITPTMPTIARRPRQRPTRGRPIRPGPHDRHRGKVARCVGGMDQDRRLVVRDERDVEHDNAFCRIAII